MRTGRWPRRSETAVRPRWTGRQRTCARPIKFCCGATPSWRLAACEAVSVYSEGVARWLLGDLAGAEARIVESADLFRGLSGSSERVLSPLNIAEMRSSAAAGQPGLRIVFEETLQPFVEISC